MPPLWLVNVSAGADVEVSTEPVDVVVSAAGADVVDAAFVVTVALARIYWPFTRPSAVVSAGSGSIEA